MGVMLSLDRPGLARNRRSGRHARRPDEQAWPEVLTALRRADPPPAGCLVRLAKNVLAGLLIPAEGEAVGQPDRVCEAGQEPGPSDRVPVGRPARPGRDQFPSDLSGACLLGQCQDAPGARGCTSASCRHDCHSQWPAPGEGTARPVSSVA